MTVDTQGTVTGQRNGITTGSLGDGETTITTTAAVTGTTEVGITATLGKYNSIGLAALSTFKLSGKGTGNKIQGGHPASYGTNLTINSQAAVTGGETGISGRSSGSGFVSITTTAAVTGTSNYGIAAINYAGTDLTIDASDTVTGGEVGILGVNLGNGATTITTTAAVNGNNDTGIYAYNYDSATDLSINAQGDIIGWSLGINARNLGTGMTMVTTTSAVTSINDTGISASNGSAATDLTLNAQANVTGSYGGMVVGNNGTGMTSVSTAGAVSGNTAFGIYARAAASTTTTTTIDISGDVDGAEHGLRASHQGSGDLQITTSAAITGGSDYAINTRTGLGGNSIINLNTGTIVSATSAMGIQNDMGDSAITVATGAFVIGSISLGDGSDDLTFSGGDFSGVTTFDGGDDTDVADGFIDTLTFVGSSGLLVAADVTNWESIAIEAGSTITFDGIEILVTPSLSNAGRVNTQDGAVDDSLTLSGDFTGGGTLSLDTVADDGSGGSDVFVVQGNLTSGTTVINIANLGGAGGQTTGNGILLVQVAGSSPAGSFSMVPFTVGGFDYQLVQVGLNWYLQSTLLTYPITEIANPVAGGSVSCTPNPVDYDGSASCTATANTGYTFVDWSGDCTGAGACDLSNVTADQSVTATFTGVILEPVAIPTIGQWGTGLLAFLLGGMGWHRLRRRTG